MVTQRFYEKHPTVNKAIALLFKLPDDFQTIMAKSLSSIANQKYQAHERFRDLKSLGVQKILAIHKSKQKKRPYDQNPIVHQALNELLVLSEEERIVISGQMLELMSFFQEYLQACQMYSTRPQLETLEEIARFFTEHGPAETRTLLNAIRAKMQNEQLLTKAQQINIGSSGMRIVAKP